MCGGQGRDWRPAGLGMRYLVQLGKQARTSCPLLGEPLLRPKESSPSCVRSGLPRLAREQDAHPGTALCFIWLPAPSHPQSSFMAFASPLWGNSRLAEGTGARWVHAIFWMGLGSICLCWLLSPWEPWLWPKDLRKRHRGAFPLPGTRTQTGLAQHSCPHPPCPWLSRFPRTFWCLLAAPHSAC